VAKNYDNSDLVITSRLDLVIGHDGDIMTSIEDPLRSLYQQVKIRIMSDQGDWDIYREIGASVSAFVGEPNNKITAESLKKRVIASMTRNGLIDNADIDVKYMPIDRDKLAFRISVRVAPTAKNVNSDTLRINLIYSYSENNAYFLS